MYNEANSTQRMSTYPYSFELEQFLEALARLDFARRREPAPAQEVDVRVDLFDQLVGLEALVLVGDHRATHADDHTCSIRTRRA